MGYFIHHSIVIQRKKCKKIDKLIPHAVPKEIQPVAFVQENEKKLKNYLIILQNRKKTLEK